MVDYKILTIPEYELTLRKQSLPVSKEEILTIEFQKFLDKLIQTAQHARLPDGWQTAGLAAVQVGVEKQVLLIRELGTDNFKEYINPVYDVIGTSTSKGLEGCLSIPNVTGYVIRPKKIKVTYLDRQGKQHKERLSGWDARIFLHEYDHLIGVLFTDKMI